MSQVACRSPGGRLGYYILQLRNTQSMRNDFRYVSRRSLPIIDQHRSIQHTARTGSEVVFHASIENVGNSKHRLSTVCTSALQLNPFLSPAVHRQTPSNRGIYRCWHSRLLTFHIHCFKSPTIYGSIKIP